MLGGSGYGFDAGESVDLRFGHDALAIIANKTDFEETIPYVEIVDLGISGPGSVTTGGGFIGGGFGVGGALGGMAVALILNLVSTQTKIHTFLTVVTNLGELHFHYGGLEPGALRIALSEVFTSLRHLDPAWLNTRLERLQALRDQKVLSQDEFERLKQRLLVPPTPPPRVKQAAAQESEPTTFPTCGKLVGVDCLCWRPKA